MSFTNWMLLGCFLRWKDKPHRADQAAGDQVRVHGVPLWVARGV